MKNILVLTYWSYKDALIQTYTLPYLKIMHKYLPKGSTIYLMTQEQGKHKVTEADKIDIEKELIPYKIKLVPLDYVPFGGKALLKWLKAIAKLHQIILKEGITHIHAFCTTAGSVGYALSKLSGKPLVLDSFEPHAEAMVENGTWKAGGFPYKFLLQMERLQYQRATHIIAATAGMSEYAAKTYGGVKKKMWVKPACVDLDLFSPAKVKQEQLLEEVGLKDKLVCVYAGKFGGIYLDQEVFDFFKVAYDFWGDSFRVLMLSNQSREDIDAWCLKAGLPPKLVINKFVPHAKVADYMGLGDFAITPVKPVPTKRYCTPVKNGEYWALGLPVVSTANISDDSDIIKDNAVGALLPTLSEDAYKQSVHQIDLLLKQPKQDVINKIRTIAQKYRSFEIAESVYQEIYGAKQK